MIHLKLDFREQNQDIRYVRNHFGTLVVDESKAFTLPLGLIGMPSAKRFVIVPCPIKKLQNFLVWQSMDDDSLAILSLALNIADNDFYSNQEIAETIERMRIDADNAILMVFVSLDSNKKMVANLRAPLLLDVLRMDGSQLVWPNQDIPESHVL